MGKEVADVALRLWTPVGTEIKFVKQVAPTVEELTDRRTEAGPRAGDYPTGSWGDESRDYHVCVRGPHGRHRPGDAGRPGLAGDPAERRKRAEPRRAGARTSGVDRRHGGVHVDQSAGRALHGSGGTGTGHPTGSGRTQSWEMSTEQRPSWAVPFSSPAPRATPILRNCLRRWWTWSTPRQVLCD